MLMTLIQWGKDKNTIKENTEALLDASMEVDLEVSQQKTKYMLMTLCQKIRRKNSIKTTKRSFEDVAKFKYLEQTLIDQNCTHEEIKSRLNTENACYHSLQSLLSSRLLSMDVKVKIYRTQILPVA
jgi:hypothetical protein